MIGTAGYAVAARVQKYRPGSAWFPRVVNQGRILGRVGIHDEHGTPIAGNRTVVCAGAQPAVPEGQNPVHAKRVGSAAQGIPVNRFRRGAGFVNKKFGDSGNRLQAYPGAQVVASDIEQAFPGVGTDADRRSTLVRLELGRHVYIASGG